MSPLSAREWAVCHFCLYVSGLCVTLVCTRLVGWFVDWFVRVFVCLGFFGFLCFSLSVYAALFGILQSSCALL